MRVLVTGGAGYIGGHAVHALLRAGFEVQVVDDLSNGHADVIPKGVLFHRADVTAPGVLAEFVERSRAEAILHFAARIQVGESVSRPDLYYATNVGGVLRVAEVATRYQLPVIFSSTAAVYGEPEVLPIPVAHPCRPQNPYGWSKRFSEQILEDCGRASGLPFVILRYFNAAGADTEARLPERHEPETHLVPLAIDAARLGKTLAMYGDDWPTEDGTCVRDYVHVSDLVEAHLLALQHLIHKKPSCTLNLGAGLGVSVRKVLDVVGRAVGKPVPVKVAPRRLGDVASLVADISEARTTLGWNPTRSSIEQIVADALSVR